jgi:predicted dehydrogenase
MTLGLGLAGAGRRAAAVHAPAIARCEQVRFAGVWSRTPAAAQALAGRYQATAYADYDEFVAHCDAVAFAVPPARQGGAAREADRR